MIFSRHPVRTEPEFQPASIFLVGPALVFVAITLDQLAPRTGFPKSLEFSLNEKNPSLLITCGVGETSLSAGRDAVGIRLRRDGGNAGGQVAYLPFEFLDALAPLLQFPQLAFPKIAEIGKTETEFEFKVGALRGHGLAQAFTGTTGFIFIFPSSCTGT